MLDRSGGPPTMLGCNYDPRQLDMFKAVLDEALVELRVENPPLTSADQLERTRIRLAAAIFFLSNQGVHEPDSLKALAKEVLQDSEHGPMALRLVTSG